MRVKMTIKVKSLIWAILGIVSVGSLITSIFDISNLIYYIADLLNIILFAYAMKDIQLLRRIRNFRWVGRTINLFFVIALLGIIFNSVSLLLAIWGTRNIFRTIMFFVSCIVLLQKRIFIHFLINYH